MQVLILNLDKYASLKEGITPLFLRSFYEFLRTFTKFLRIPASIIINYHQSNPRKYVDFLRKYALCEMCLLFQ